MHPVQFDSLKNAGECDILDAYQAPVAQRIEQLPSKQLVTGSIPVRGTIFLAKSPLKTAVILCFYNIFRFIRKKQKKQRLTKICSVCYSIVL